MDEMEAYKLRTTLQLKFLNLENKNLDSFLIEPIQCLAYSFGANIFKSDESSPEQACMQDISITKYVGANSSTLMRAVMDKRLFQSIEFEAENKNHNILYKFSDATITSISTGGSGGEDKLTENISIRFKSLEMIFQENLKDATKTSKTDLIKNLEPAITGIRRY